MLPLRMEENCRRCQSDATDGASYASPEGLRPGRASKGDGMQEEPRKSALGSPKEVIDAPQERDDELRQVAVAR